MAAGVTSDHELTSSADLMQKLAAGLTIELRGSHDHLLQEFVRRLERHRPSAVDGHALHRRRLPDELVQDGGGLDDVMRRLVRYGMKPEWALRAATFNAAQRLKRSDLGLIAAGRRADIVLFEDLDRLRPRARLRQRRDRIARMAR